MLNNPSPNVISQIVSEVYCGCELVFFSVLKDKVGNKEVSHKEHGSFYHWYNFYNHCHKSLEYSSCIVGLYTQRTQYFTQL